jgi:hypothetical protein
MTVLEKEVVAGQLTGTSAVRELMGIFLSSANPGELG